MTEDFADPFVAHGRDLDIAGAPDGALSGLTFAVKDLYDVEGLPTGAGNPAWLATHAPAARTASSVQRLLDAGARLVGKTQTDELAYSLMGLNAHYGAPQNPRAPDRITGGSSSGSAAAVAQGLADFALGTDTGGSVRIPASFCGLFGIRPSHGAIATDGIVPLSESFDVVGWFTRDPDIFAKVGDALLPDAGARPGLRRLLIEQSCWDATEPETRDALRPALDALKTMSESDETVTLAPNGFEAWRETFRIVQGFEAWQAHGAWIETADPKFGPGVKERFALAATVTATEAVAARAQRREIRGMLIRRLGPDGVLCLPTSPAPAPRRDATEAAVESVRVRLLEFTCIAGLGGLPQVSIPAAEADGAPVGLSLVGPPGSDRALIDLAGRLWSALG